MKWKLLLYCNKTRPILRKLDKYFLASHTDNYYWKKGQTVPYKVNGKIVAECDFEVEEIFEDNFEDARDGYVEHFYTLKSYDDFDEGQKVLLKESCLQKHELSNYLGFENGYAIHIKNLHIFGTPMELNNFLYEDNTDGHYGVWEVERTPANYTAIATDVKDIGGVYCYRGTCGRFLALSSRELCDILNGEKTIMVRKKVLKEMLV